MKKSNHGLAVFVLFVFSFAWQAVHALSVNVTGTFSDVTRITASNFTSANDPSCFDARQPVTAPIPGADPLNNQIRYGDPFFGSGLPSSCDPIPQSFPNKSGLGFQGGIQDIVCPAENSGDPVNLGVFTHLGFNY